MVKRQPKIIEGVEISQLSLQELGFSPEILNELYDALNQTKEVIGTYYESSSRFPTRMRDEIGKIMVESDMLILAFNDIYVTASDLIEKLKKKQLGQRVVISKKEKQLMLQQLEVLKMRVRKLIQNAEEYVREVKKYHNNQPLPI